MNLRTSQLNNSRIKYYIIIILTCFEDQEIVFGSQLIRHSFFLLLRMVIEMKFGASLSQPTR